LNGLALCAGYGGLELAIERVFPTYRTVCYVEGEAFAVQHLVKKMEEGRLDHAPIWSNVRTFDGEPWRGKVDFISGGFPCQPYSSAGKQLAHQDPRDLWPDFVRIVGEVRPSFLFFENVPGIVKWRLNEIVLDLDKLGYHASWCVVAASEVGALHRRKRWFLMGVKHDDSKTQCIRWNADKQSSPRRQFDFEGLCPNVSNPNDSSQCSSCGSIRQKNRDNACRVCKNVSYPVGSRSFESCKMETFEQKPKQQNLGIIGSCRFPDKWEGRFDSMWETEPGLGRLVDGATDWVDKLRILGNGVVPQQAYSALQMLGARLACGIVANREPKG